MGGRKTKSQSEIPVRARIESLSHDGRGVAHLDGKTVFIDGALPGEEVDFVSLFRRRRFDQGRAVEIVSPSVHRVETRCPHFGVCGGCTLQHLEPGAQILAKQQVLLENLQRIGDVQPERVLEPLTGPHWGYRHKARLGVKYVPKKARVLVGFRERYKSLLADLSRCEVLHPSVGSRITELAALIDGLSLRSRIPQIEVAVGDNTAALVFRHLAPFNAGDLKSLTDFGCNHDLHIYLQAGGPETISLLWPKSSRLFYSLPEHAIELTFHPADFVQINPEINRAMVNRVLEYLQPAAGERVLDLFCGLGNFSLPLARRAGEVIGVDGDPALVRRARENAARNGVGNAQFFTADLTRVPGPESWAVDTYEKVLLDPPRSGARELMEWVAKTHAQRIVYVSCHPGSLARDAAALVHRYGYRLLSAGVMDMFPHTAHVESIAVFAPK